MITAPPLTVLVTGCSSGIGKATARLLADRGFRVLAGIRCQQHADDLAATELTNLEPVLLDVTSDANVSQIIELVRDSSPNGLYAVVNNAGVGLPAAVELSTLDEVRNGQNVVVVIFDSECDRERIQVVRPRGVLIADTENRIKWQAAQ